MNDAMKKIIARQARAAADEFKKINGKDGYIDSEVANEGFLRSDFSDLAGSNISDWDSVYQYFEQVFLSEFDYINGGTRNVH